MKQDRVALLIDADNVSIDVIEQAVVWVAKHLGGPHLRRAYCTPEAAVKHQDAFKRLSVRPMVNLAAGKNSTDIALAVDAIEIAVVEQPDVVVIASSDSDFAPVVARLRERGCRVVGLGQHGKVGQETRGVYDDYEVFEHRGGGGDDDKPAPRKRASRAASGASRASAGTGTRTAAKKAAAGKAAKKAAPAKTPRKTTARKKAADEAEATAPEAAAVVEADVTAAPAAKRGSRSRKKAAAPAEAPSHEVLPHEGPSHQAVEGVVPRRGSDSRGSDSRGSDRRGSDPRGSDPRGAESRDAVLDALPALAQGGSLAFNDVGQKLRAAGLLGRSGSSTKLLKRVFGDALVLEPSADRPSRVRLAMPG